MSKVLDGFSRFVTPARLAGRRATIALGALVLAVVACGAVLWGVNHHHDQEEDAGRSAAAFATDAVPKLLSYDVTTVGDLTSSNASLMTGKFGDQYAELVRTKLVPGVKKRSLTNQTKVVTSAVVSSSTSKATLLLFLDQVSKAKGMSAPATTGSRVRLVVVKSDGHWQVDQLDPI